MYFVLFLKNLTALTAVKKCEKDGIMIKAAELDVSNGELSEFKKLDGVFHLNREMSCFGLLQLCKPCLCKGSVRPV